MKNYIECAFVNGNPVKYGKIIGYKATKNCETTFRDELVLSVVREVYYPHPDCSDALLLVKEEKVVSRAEEGDENYASIYMLFMAQELCQKITTK